MQSYGGLNSDGTEDCSPVSWRHLSFEASGSVEVSPSDCTKDVIDGVLGGDGAVEGDKVSLDSVRNVVPPPSRMVHGRHVLQHQYHDLSLLPPECRPGS